MCQVSLKVKGKTLLRRMFLIFDQQSFLWGYHLNTARLTGFHCTNGEDQHWWVMHLSCRDQLGKDLGVDSGLLVGGCGSFSCVVLCRSWNVGLATFWPGSLRDDTLKVWQRRSPSNELKATLTWSSELLLCMTFWTWCQRASNRTRPVLFFSI